jgi:GT2 family glycosyltransferase
VPLLDIIVPAYNNPDITARCLSGVFLTAPKGTRVILVNNGSTDAGVEKLRPYVEAMGGVYVGLSPNCGPYGAVNAGLTVRAADPAPKWGVVCNDAVPLPGAFHNLLANVDDDRFRYLGALEVQDSAGFDLSKLEVGLAKAKLPNGVLVGKPFFTCFIATQSLLEAVGAFDERFKLTYGDTDWEQRATDVLGKPLHTLCSAPCYHGASVTRKRLGVEEDVRVDCADQQAFLDKWADREDVMARHRKEDPDFKKQWLTREWSMRGEK